MQQPTGHTLFPNISACCDPARLATFCADMTHSTLADMHFIDAWYGKGHEERSSEMLSMVKNDIGLVYRCILIADGLELFALLQGIFTAMYTHADSFQDRREFVRHFGQCTDNVEEETITSVQGAILQEYPYIAQ